MKKGILFTIFYFMLICFSNNVNASEIQYNLNITDDANLKEKIIYKIDKNKMVKGSYDFLTSIVEDPVYFDNDRSVLYKKKKISNESQYIVTLENSFYPMFLSNERIIKECFTKNEFINNEEKLSVKLNNPFYCLHRADSIKINIKTNLKVLESNHNSVKDNIYTWYPSNDEFYLKFSVEMPMSDDLDTMEGNLESQSEEEYNQDEDSSKNIEKTEQQESKINPIIIIAIISSIIVFGLIVAVILKSKKSNLNKI